MLSEDLMLPTARRGPSLRQLPFRRFGPSPLDIVMTASVANACWTHVAERGVGTVGLSDGTEGQRRAAVRDGHRGNA
jgi:hypothetical protein